MVTFSPGRYGLFITLLVTAAILCFTSISSAATMKAFVDRNPVGLDQSFRLIIEADSSPNGNPNFAPLKKDFEILGQNQSSSFNMVNGSVSRKIEWHLTLMAKRAGTLQIPSIPFGSDRSPALQLVVQGAAATGKQTTDTKEIFLEVEADRTEAYVQSQIIYTVKLYRSVNLSSASLTDPEFSGVEIITHKLGEDSNFEQNINGVRYIVTARTYALFPQQSGTLTINPIVFEGQVITQRGSFFNQQGRIVRKRSDSESIKILPTSPTYLSPIWLPSTAVTLNDSWSVDPSKLTVGEPVTRTITIRGKGLTAAQLPDIEFDIPSALKVYPDKPETKNIGTTKGITGSRVYKYAIIPSAAGTFDIPEVGLGWWDITNRKSRKVAIPARTLNIVPGSGSATTTAPVQPTAPAATSTSTVQSAGEATERIIHQTDAGFWPWLSLTLALGWIATVIFLLKRPVSRKMAETDQPAKTASVKRLHQQAVTSCKGSEPEVIRDAIIAWGRAAFDIGDKANLGIIAEEVPAPLAKEIRELQRLLYGNAEAVLRRGELQVELEKFSVTVQKTKINTDTVLPQLYPD